MQTIRCTKGDTVPFTIDAIVDESGTVITSLSGWTFFFTLKLVGDAAADDSAALVSKTSPATITISGVTVSCELTAAETGALTVGTNYVWDIQAKTPAGKIFTLDRGVLIVERDVTRRTT